MSLLHPRRRIALALSTSVTLTIAATASPALADLAAFAGAQGFGALTTGARAAAAPTIVVVNTLADDPSGAVAGQTTLRDALSGSNRIVVFAVGGYINLNSTAISAKSNLTILGQTAPGQGISTMGAEISFSNQHNDILQYFRGREGSQDTNVKTAYNLGNSTNMILDHVDAEFAQYDNIDDVYPDVYANVNHTIMNSMIADPIKVQQFNIHEEGASVTYLNDIWANSHNRNPLAKGDTQFVNNVVYDYQGGYTTGNSSGTFKYDIISNYFIAGPSTSSPGNAFYQLDSNQSAYLVGNMLDSNKDGSLNGSNLTTADGANILPTYYSPGTKFLPTLTAAQAFAFDMLHAGDMYNANGTWTRDEVDAVIASQVASNGTLGSIINTQASDGASNGGWGTLSNATIVGNAAYFDTVPVTWITAHGIPATTAGLLTKNALGYYMIEQYAQEVGDQYGTMVASAGDYSSLSYPASSPAIYTHLLISGTGATNGTLTLSAVNTAAGAFSVGIGANGPAAGETLTVSGGSLTVQDTIYVGYQNNGTLNLSSGTVMADNVQIGNTVYSAAGAPTSYTGNLNITGGTLQVSNIVLGAGTPGSYTTGGSINFSGGTIQAFGNLTISAPIVLSGNATVNTLGPDSVAYAGLISSKITGAGTFTKAGAGILTLSNNNTFTGNVTISGGSLLAANNNAFGNNTVFVNIVSGLQLAAGVTLSNPIVANAGSNEFEDFTATGSATIAGPVSGIGSQFRVGISGTTSVLTFTGATTTNVGIVLVTRGNITYANNGSLISNNSAVIVGRGGNTSTANLTVKDNALVQGNGITLGGLNGTSDSIATTVTVSGNATLSAGTSSIDLSNNDTAGTTALILNGGTLKGGSFTMTGSNHGATTVTFNGGTLLATAGDSATSFFPALGAATANPVVAKISTGGLLLNDGGFNITIAQPLTNAFGTDGGLTKSGNGSVSLTAANTYNGNTTVNAGSLYVNNTTGSGVGTGTVILNAGLFGGSGTLSGAITAGNAPHTINPGAVANTVGTLTAASLTTNANTTLAFDLASPSTTSDKLAITGNLSLGGGTLAINSQSTTGNASLGYYKVISYAGSLSGSTANLLLPAVQNNIAYTLDSSHDAGFIDIHRGYIGDANDDGTVDLNDLNTVLNNLGAATSSWTAGNFDGDATIDLNDLNSVLNNLGTSIPAASIADAQALVAATPEPASLALLSLAAPLLLRRRRK